MKRFFAVASGHIQTANSLKLAINHKRMADEFRASKEKVNKSGQQPKQVSNESLNNALDSEDKARAHSIY